MASFKEVYELQFGKTPDYDPIKMTERTERRAEGIQAGVPDPAPYATDVPRQAIPFPAAPTPAPAAGQRNPYLRDTIKSFGSGIVQVGEMLTGGVEYVARQNEFLDGAFAETVYGGRQWLSGINQNIMESMSELDQERIVREVATLDPDRSIWRGGPRETAAAIGLKFSQALPATLTILAPGALWFRAASPAKAFTFMGTTEGTMSMGQVQSALADEINEMELQQLMEESPRFAELMQEQGGSETLARKELIREAQGLAPLAAGAIVASLSLVAGRFIQPLFDPRMGGGRGLLGRMGTGFAVEAPTEAMQGGSEQVIENFAARLYDAGRAWHEDVAEAAGQEGLLGGLTGMVFTGAAGRRRTRPPPPPAPGEPGPGGQMPLPGVDPGGRAAAEEVAGMEVAVDEPPITAESRVVQVWDEAGDVIHETLATNQAEADALIASLTKEQAGRVVSMSPREAAERRQLRGERTGAIPVQEDMFDNRLARGDTPVLVGEPYGPGTVRRGDVEPDGQIPLPGFGRRSAIPSTAVEEDVYDPATDRWTPSMGVQQEMSLPPRETLPVPYAPPEGEQMVLPLGTGRRRGVGRTTLTELPRGYEPGAEPVTVAEPGDPAGDRAAIDRRMGDLFDPTRTPATPPYKTVAEMVADKLRAKKLPIEDRAAVAPALKGAKSETDAAARALAAGAKALAAEDKLRIGGFHPPNRYDWAGSRYEQEYQAAWSRLLDAELTIELSKQKREVERAKKRRDAALKELAEIRAIAKPKLKEGEAGKYVRVAQALDEAGVRDFIDERTGVDRPIREAGPQEPRAPVQPTEADETLGEFQPMTREQIDDLADYVVRHKTPSAKEWTKESFSSAAEAYARRDEIKERYPKRSVTVDVIGTRELDAAFEQAAQFREGREAQVPGRKARPPVRQYFMVRHTDKELNAPVTAIYDTRAEAEARVAELKEQGVEATLTAERRAARATSWKEKGEVEAEIAKQEAADVVLDEAVSFEEFDADTGEFIGAREATEEGVVYESAGRAMRSEAKTPGAKLRFIRREAEHRRRAETAQRKAVRAAAVAVEAVTPEGTTQPRSKKVVKTGDILTGTLPFDESVAARVKREQKAKDVRTALRATLSKAKAYLRTLGQAEFRRLIARERHPDTGVLSKEGKDALYGRQYLAEMNQFAAALAADKDASPAMIKAMEKLDALLGTLEGMSHDTFIKQWAKLASANRFADLATISDKQIAALRDRKKAELATKKSVSRVVNRARRQRQVEEVFKKDVLYNKFIAPVLQKMSDSLARVIETDAAFDVYMPSEEQIAGIRYAMQTYKNDWSTGWNPAMHPADKNEVMGALDGPSKKETLYQPLSAILEDFGFTFDKNGNVNGFVASESYLGPAFKKRFGEAKQAVSHFTLQEAPARGPLEALEPAPRKERALEQESIELTQQNALYDRLNGLIDAFKARATTKATITGLKRAEERFIRGLKKIDSFFNISPGIGRIVLPDGRGRTYRMIAPRLDAKTLRKAEAREAIHRMTKVPVPARVLPQVRAMRKTEAHRKSVDAFLSKNDQELFIESAAAEKYDSDYLDAAAQIGDQLVAGEVSGDTVVTAILEQAPVDSFYYQLAERLSGHTLSTVEVAYGVESDFPGGQLGKYSRSAGVVLLNREALNRYRSEGEQAFGARVVHTLTHELLHAMTHRQIDTNPALSMFLSQLQNQARVEARNRGLEGKMYGLKPHKNEVHEFVAEAFSNNEFQMFLKSVPFGDRGTLWSRFVDSVRKLIGLDPQTPPSTLFDAIMLTENILFDDVGLGGTRQLSDLFLEHHDSVMRNVAEQFSSRAQQSGQLFSRALDSIRRGGRNLMTFRQLSEVYTKYFDSADGNPLKNYMDAWAARNASISALTKVPEKMSGRWTSLEVSNPAAAQEMSRLMTEATMNKMSPALELTVEQKAEMDAAWLERHEALRARYLALPHEARQLYDDAKNYYAEAADQEGKLLITAALRGVLTKGRNATMTAAEFRQTFTEEKIDTLRDRESVHDALQDIVPADQLDGLVTEVTRMAGLRRQRIGDYFPLMRYGDYAVYAEKVRKEEVLGNRKDMSEDDFNLLRREARGRKKEVLMADPTLDADVFENAEGDLIYREIDREFVMGESKSEVETHRARLQEEYGADDPRTGKSPVSDVQRRISKETDDMAINSNAALHSILTSLAGNAGAQQAIKNFYLRSLSDNAFRKHELNRKNRRGVNYDHQHRNLANYSKQAAYYRSQLKYGWQMSEAIQEMDKFLRARQQHLVPPAQRTMTTEQLQAVFEQVRYRDKLGSDPMELDKMVRKGVEVTQFMMLTSASYWMVNASQPWLVTSPVLGGRFGMGQALAALAHAQSLVKTPLSGQALRSWAGLKAMAGKEARVVAEQSFNVIDQLFEHLRAKEGGEELVTLIERMRGQNIIDINVLTEMRQIAAGQDTGVWARVLDTSRIMAHITEVNNRTVTAIASYTLEKNRQMEAGAGKEAAIEAATDYALDMISQTQYDYSTQNKPPLFQSGGPLKWAAPLMFQFMQWPQHMYALLIRNFHGWAMAKDAPPSRRREARNALIGLLGTHAAIGGMVGMALQPIKWALGMVMFAFGDQDEPYTLANAISGRTFDRMVTEVGTELFGSNLGTAFARGIPASLGHDVSMRLSMGTAYFVDVRGDTAESILGSLTTSFGGATLNQVVNWGHALSRIAEGDVMRGVEQASPKILKDALKAVRFYNEGLVNSAGDTIIPAEDMTFREIFVQGLGFAPDRVSRTYQAQSAILGARGHAQARRDTLVADFLDAGTPGERAEVIRSVAEFNRAFPSLAIRASTLVRAAVARKEREDRYRRHGANIDEKQARDFKRHGEPFRR